MSNKKNSSKCIEIIIGVTNERPDLDNHIEAADMRIIPHIAKSIESGLKNVVAVCNDTDVCVLLLHYTPQFIKAWINRIVVEIYCRRKGTIHTFAYTYCTY